MSSPLSVAIVGGGFVGMTLGIALGQRGIPFKLFESRGSFTQIGAGITITGPGLQALRLVKPTLGDGVFDLCVKAQSGTYFVLRYGANQGRHKEGDMIYEVVTPLGGLNSASRSEVLNFLAQNIDLANVSFNRKFLAYEQFEDHVVMKFADGSEEKASLLIGCDGIHSQVRIAMFGESNPVSQPYYSGLGGYRAVIPMEKIVEVLGEFGRRFQMWLGPQGFFVMYPINGGKAVNCGAWGSRPLAPQEDRWVIPNQRKELDGKLKDWGDRMQKIIENFGEETSFWPAYEFSRQPEKFHDRRILIIGDAAHAMPPHQGAGASEGLADAYVLAEVLSDLKSSSPTPSSREIELAMRAVEEVRRPRFERLQRYSTEAGLVWQNFFESKLEGDALRDWQKLVQERREWVLRSNWESEAKDAILRLTELLNGMR